MAIKTFTTGEVLTAADTNTYLANSGLVFIKSQTVGTAVLSVNVTSCFSATYDNYLISVQNVACTASNAAYFKLLNGTTPTTTGFYGSTYFFQPGVAGGLSSGVQTNSSFCETLSHAAASGMGGTFTVSNPFVTRYTNVVAQNLADDYGRYCMAIHKSSTSYDGFQMLPGTGTFTGGTITVYGYRLG